ncbi:MAG: TonB-dependent receptor [Phenylobacterium sp.]|nr:MAG: TonB-dependent receptor [Phenylobacterium sp.]
MSKNRVWPRFPDQGPDRPPPRAGEARGGDMTNTIRNLFCATAFIAPWMVCGSALAADAAPATEVEAVVVTAEKRGEDIQQVPIAVTAVSGVELADRGQMNLRDIAAAIPNLMWSENTGTTMITIRGVGSTVNSGLTEPTIAVFVDGVYLPRSTMATTRSLDLDRLEVLRGPQGTLYGRNATGGAINFISQAPTETFTGMATLMTGSRSDAGIEGYVSGPITDRVLFRLSGGTEKQTGFVTVSPSGEHLNGTDVDYVRGALRLRPTDDLTIDLAARYERQTAPNAYQQLLTPTNLATTAQTAQPNQIIANDPFSFKTETTIGSATVNWKISDRLSLKSITSYVDHSNTETFDADSTGLSVFNTANFYRPSKSEGQEFNLIGDNGRLQWLLGAFFFHENSDVVFPLAFGQDFAPLIGLPTGTQLTQSVGSKTTSYALFGNLTYAVTDRLKLEFGLRYNDERQVFAQGFTIFLPGVGVVPGEPAFANGPITTKTSSHKFLPKIGVQYQLSDEANLYASYSVGYKSGGENLEGGSGESIGAAGLYKPEELDAYEVGLKSRWLDRRLTANFAAFYYKYTGLQVTNIVPPSSGFVQSADARNYGLEGEVTWKATSNLRIDASATWLHARFHDFHSFDDANPGLGLQNLDGHPVPEAPDVTFNLGADYTIPLETRFLSSLVLRGDVRYSDRVVLRWFGTPEDSQAAYTLVNLSAKLLSADQKTSLDVFLNNVGDTRYKLYSFYIAPVGAYFGNYGTPRSWGLRLSHRF